MHNQGVHLQICSTLLAGKWRSLNCPRVQVPGRSQQPISPQCFQMGTGQTSSHAFDLAAQLKESQLPICTLTQPSNHQQLHGGHSRPG